MLDVSQLIISRNETGEALEGLQTDKSASADGIHRTIAKPLASVVGRVTRSLFQVMIMCGMVPA